MIIKFENFGPIKEFIFDSAYDLNIIFGKNNIGKSYSISAVYLIIKNLINYQLRYYDEPFLSTQNNKEKRRGISDVLVDKIKITDEKTKEISINKETEEFILLLLENSLIINLTQSFINSYSSLENIQNKLSKKQFKLTITFESAEISIGLNSKHDRLIVKEVKIWSKIILKKINSIRNPKSENGNLTFYYNTKTSTITHISALINWTLSNMISSIQSEIQNVYFLPASRSGLYNALNTFSAIIAELSQSRNFLRTKIEIPNISEPVSDYFLNLSSIKNNSISNQIENVVAEIENNILKGKVTFNTKSKKLIYQPEGLKLELDLSVTSSMISEIAPIVAHLKFLMNNKVRRNTYSNSSSSNLIFIEEPEAHLHPEVQVLLIKIFTSLITKKIKIVMTSHSNYIFNKLNNIILANDIDSKKVSISLMENGKEGSFIKKGAMKLTESGIEDNNFNKVAEDLYIEREDIYNLKNNDRNS